MHSTAERKAAIRKFKERKPRVGVFAVRRTAAAQTWVGSAGNLDATRNRFWFCLRSGVHPDKSLQCEWNACGEQAFQYKILEELEDDLSPLAITDLLRKRNITGLRNGMQYHFSVLVGPRDPLNLMNEFSFR
jgi:hypothetical protein